MACGRVRLRQFRAEHLAAHLLGGALILLGLVPGCTGNVDDRGALLDSTLVNAERLLDAGNVIDARKRLLAGLAGSSGEWKGMQAAAAYRLLGDLSLQIAQLDSAIIFYARAEESYRGRVQRYEAFQMSLARVGVHRMMQKEETARDEAGEALRLATLFGDSAAATDIRWVLLEVYRVLEQPAEMEQMAKALRASCQRSGDVSGDARIWYLLGKAASERGEVASATQYFLQSISLAGKVKDSSLVAEALLSLASAFEHAGKLHEAQESYATALHNTSNAASGVPLRIQALMRIGNFYMRISRPEIAAAYFDNAATLAHSQSNGVAEGYAQLQGGQCRAVGNRSDAVSMYRQGYELLGKAGHAYGCAYALIAMGRIAELENKVTDAAQIYRAAVRAQESAYASRAADDLWLECEETVLGRGGADAYGAMVSLLLQMGKGEEAFRYQERSNARRLSDDLAAWNVRTGIGAADSALHRYRHVRALHIGAERQLENLASTPRGTASLMEDVKGELNRLEEQIGVAAERTRYSDSRLAAIAATDGLKPEDVQKHLEGDESLVLYLPALRALHACVVTPSAVNIYMAAANPQRVTQLAEQYLQECARLSGAADSGRAGARVQDPRLQELTRGLYEAMVLPLEPALKHGGRMIIVLPSRMPAMPIAGLRRGGSPLTPALGERIALSYLPTAQFIQSVKPAHAQTRTVVALGVRGATMWDVEYELRDINAFYNNARMLFGKDATLASLRSVRADLLHLAVEVRYSTRRPLTGVVLLGDGNTDDGSVPTPIEEVFSLPPVAGVVVSNLSSRLPTADRALAAAFLANGASSVIMNAAPLSRKAKKVFGESFYTALQTGATVPVAFRGAQNSLARSKDLSAPNFWAPMMMWGR